MVWFRDDKRVDFLWTYMLWNILIREIFIEMQIFSLNKTHSILTWYSV